MSNPMIYLSEHEKKGTNEFSPLPTNHFTSIIMGRELHVGQDNENKASESLLGNVEYHMEEQQKMLNRLGKGFNHIDSDVRPHYLNNKFILPPGMMLACNPFQARTNLNIIELEDTLCQKIITTFSISREFLNYDDDRKKSVSKDSYTSRMIVDKFSLLYSLQEYDSFLSNLWQIVYVDIFQNECKQELIFQYVSILSDILLTDTEKKQPTRETRNDEKNE
jgi:hypothetical protein